MNRNMPIEKPETNESQIGLTMSSTGRLRYIKTEDDKLRFLDSSALNSLRSPPSTAEIIIIDDEEEEVTLEPKKKNPRLGSWWDISEPFNELSCVVKGSREAKEDNDLVLRVDSCTDLQETKTDKKNDNERLLPKKKNEESVGESSARNKGDEHVTLEDLGVSKEDLKSIPWEAFDPTWEIRSDPWLGGYM